MEITEDYIKKHGFLSMRKGRWKKGAASLVRVSPAGSDDGKLSFNAYYRTTLVTTISLQYEFDGFVKMFCD